MKQKKDLKDLFELLINAQTSKNKFLESKFLPKILNIITPLEKKKSFNNPKLDFYYRICIGTTGCWFWRGACNPDGYGNYKKKNTHRVSFELFNGDIPDKMHVLHSCDVRNCVNPKHLYLGTHLDNMKDCNLKKRYKYPTKPILDKNKVKEIRNKHKLGATNSSLSKEYKVSRSCISFVVNNKSWKV